MKDDTIEISAEIPTRMAEAFRSWSSTAVADDIRPKQHA
jgi:hypothetical protein